MNPLWRLWDQILLWDTAPDATVTLAGSPEGFREKVIATHLLGGSIVVRPAELFEGPDYYFEDAVSDSGFLRNLLRENRASLALSNGMTLEERVNWRFSEGRVFDRGRLITNAADVETVRARTVDRAERLAKVGWAPAPLQMNERSKAEREHLVSERSREALLAVGSEFFGPMTVHETPIGRFLSSRAPIESRSDLYPLIEAEWSASLPESRRLDFILACKDALTVAAFAVTASQYGGRLSELRPGTFTRFAFGAVAAVSLGAEAEVRAVRAFRYALEKSLTTSERTAGLPLIQAIESFDAPKFVGESVRLIHPEDRVELCELLYDVSKCLGGTSLVLRAAQPSVSDDVLIEEAQRRIEELQERNNRLRSVLNVLIGAKRGLWFTFTLLLLGAPPGVTTIASAAAALIDVLRGEKAQPVFAGFRKAASW